MTDSTLSADARAARPFFFVHLQKTAGTALFQRLREHFGEPAVYPSPADGGPNSVLYVDHLLERWRARRNEIRVVTGHFPLCTTELLGESFTTLTVLRDPVERTLSYLRHDRMLDLHGADEDITLEKIYEEPIRFQGLVHNHMVKMFSLTVDEMTQGAMTPVTFTRSHLERAKERLATVDVVGLQETFETFCDELASRFALDLGKPRFANRTQPIEVSSAFRDRIADDNQLDVELYDFARKLCASRGQ